MVILFTLLIDFRRQIYTLILIQFDSDSKNEDFVVPLTKNTVTAVRYEQRSRWSEVGAGSCAEDQAAWR